MSLKGYNAQNNNNTEYNNVGNIAVNESDEDLSNKYNGRTALRPMGIECG